MWNSWFWPNGSINAPNSKFLDFNFVPRDLNLQRQRTSTCDLCATSRGPLCCKSRSFFLRVEVLSRESRSLRTKLKPKIFEFRAFLPLRGIADDGVMCKIDWSVWYQRSPFASIKMISMTTIMMMMMILLMMIVTTMASSVCWSISWWDWLFEELPPVVNTTLYISTSLLHVLFPLCLYRYKTMPAIHASQFD